MARSYRFRKRVSDRSGFDYLYNEIINDNGVMVGPDEYDTPPPSDIPLGGEGDSSPSADCRTNYTSYGISSDNATAVQYLNTASTISVSAVYDKSGQRNYNQAIIYISGSNSDVTLDSTPKISAGAQGDFVTLYGVGSSVLLLDGSGISIRKSFLIDSGAIINFYYTTGANVWNETSRSHLTKSIGEL